MRKQYEDYQLRAEKAGKKAMAFKTWHKYDYQLYDLEKSAYFAAVIAPAMEYNEILRRIAKLKKRLLITD